MKDHRYKISQEDVNIMRELRREGYSYSAISELFPVNSGTVGYWCNEDSRKKQRIKNARRKYKPLDKKRMARDLKKRKELMKDNRFKTRLSFASAKDEKRRKRITARDYRTNKYIPLKKALEILDTGELHLGNAKVD